MRALHLVVVELWMIAKVVVLLAGQLAFCCFMVGREEQQIGWDIFSHGSHSVSVNQFVSHWKLPVGFHHFPKSGKTHEFTAKTALSHSLILVTSADYVALQGPTSVSYHTHTLQLPISNRQSSIVNRRPSIVV